MRGNWDTRISGDDVRGRRLFRMLYWSIVLIPPGSELGHLDDRHPVDGNYYPTFDIIFETPLFDFLFEKRGTVGDVLDELGKPGSYKVITELIPEDFPVLVLRQNVLQIIIPSIR
jgi:hypothetical protein